MTNSRILSAAFLAFAVSISPAAGHDFQVGSITINHPWSRATPPVAPVAGGYLTLTNDGEAADRLVSISSPLRDDGAMMARTIRGAFAASAVLISASTASAGQTVGSE